MQRISFYFLLLIIVLSCGSPVKVKDFEKFALQHDSLFVKAYEKRDTVVYKQLLNEFIPEFQALSDPDKKRFSNYRSNAYYNLCCTYALLDNKSEAIKYLKMAIDAGYFDYSHIRKDNDLKNIRNDKEYLEAENSIREIGDYLYILKRSALYNFNDFNKIPEFTYQSANDPNLISLKKAFKLDSIAGQGDEISRMISLLHWIHNLIPHDGNHDNPAIKNAMSLIRKCQSENRGLNCRGLATVLNECYLAEGFKSRMITCLPKDSLKRDNDCHVINMVWSGKMKKWLWMDPTNDTWVMNEKNELLGIEEVRTRLINDQPLFLNPDANWNHKTKIVVEDYLEVYMAKNLYKLNCPVRSEYNLETWENGKEVEYIQLVSLDYFNLLPSGEKGLKTLKNGNITTYFTTNPALFWKSPKN